MEVLKISPLPVKNTKLLSSVNNISGWLNLNWSIVENLYEKAFSKFDLKSKFPLLFELLDKKGSPFVIVDILIFKVGFNSCSIGFDFSNKVIAFGFCSTFLSLKPQFDKNKIKTRKTL